MIRNLAIYVLGSMISSGLNLTISCTLSWMVHNPYEVPRGFLLFLQNSFGRLSLPRKKTPRFQEMEEMIENMRDSLLQHAHSHSIRKKIRSHNAGQISEKEGSVRKENVEKVDVEPTTGEASRPSGFQESKDLHPDVKKAAEDINEMKMILKLLALLEMKEKLSAEDIAREEWKKMAIIFNRFFGVIIMVANLLLLIWCIRSILP